MTDHHESSTAAALAELGDATALRAALVAALDGRTTPVAVAVRSPAGVASAAVGELGAVPIGCLAKLLTAALVRAAVAARELALDTAVTDVLGRRAAALRGVTVRQLLEHTHGLDDSLLAPPWVRAQRIDARELSERVAGLPRLGPPGAFYSYGNVGAWLAGAVLERVHARSYGALVAERLLAPVGSRAQCRAAVPPTLCPALGVGLALTAGEIALLLGRLVACGGRWPDDAGPGAHGPVTPLPGWNPLERGIHLGFKYSGHGWFGHQSAWPGASIYVRANPARAATLVVAARELPAAVVAGRLLARRVPELFDLDARVRRAAPSDESRWAGRYERAAQCVEIGRAGDALVLRARLRERHGGPEATFAARLRRGYGCVAFVEPGSEALPFVQLVEPCPGAPALWNGRFVFRRTRALDG